MNRRILMIAHQQISIAITDRSSIGEARRMSSLMGERARMKEPELGRVPLIVTELATNLLLHATGGEIIIRMLPAETGPGIEMIALDRGPGSPTCSAVWLTAIRAAAREDADSARYADYQPNLIFTRPNPPAPW